MQGTLVDKAKLMDFAKAMKITVGQALTNCWETKRLSLCINRTPPELKRLSRDPHVENLLSANAVQQNVSSDTFPIDLCSDVAAVVLAFQRSHTVCQKLGMANLHQCCRLSNQVDL